MKFWIQEYGQRTGANRGDFKLFYCEDTSILNKLPTTTTQGDIDYALDRCEEYIQKIKPGDQCFTLDDSSVWVMRSDDAWQQL